MALDINITRKTTGHLLVTLSGRLDSETATGCEKRIAPFLPSAAQIVFDLHALDYISSSGLRLILMVCGKVAAKGGRVALRRMKPPVAKVFEIASLIPSDIADDERSADIYLDAIQGKESVKNWDVPA